MRAPNFCLGPDPRCAADQQLSRLRGGSESVWMPPAEARMPLLLDELHPRHVPLLLEHTEDVSEHLVLHIR